MVVGEDEYKIGEGEPTVSGRSSRVTDMNAEMNTYQSQRNLLASDEDTDIIIVEIDKSTSEILD